MKSLILTKEKLSNQEISWASPLSAWAVLTYVFQNTVIFLQEQLGTIPINSNYADFFMKQP